MTPTTPDSGRTPDSPGDAEPGDASRSPDVPVDQLFEQSVNQGSAQFWAVHFSSDACKPGLKAAFSFAHAMNVLTTVSPEVIAEKSVWWHEELTNTTLESARHPVTKALLGDTQGNTDRTKAILQAMHHHLHGALMTQQRTQLASEETWMQYATLRFGSLHELLALASHSPLDTAVELGRWTAQLHAAGVRRAPAHYDDARVLTPDLPGIAETEPQLQTQIQELELQRPTTPQANAVLIAHELAWWKKAATAPPFVITGLPVGLRGMLTSWRAARQAHRYLT